MLWATSPAATEVEQVVADWLVDLLGLPDGWKTTGRGGGVIQMSDGALINTGLTGATIDLDAGGDITLASAGTRPRRVARSTMDVATTRS